MFWNKEKDKKHGHEYEICSEDLAFPEIHIGKRRRSSMRSMHRSTMIPLLTMM